jgi:hypothetical protein
LFLRLGKGEDPVAFERVWRATAEYGLAADWSQPGLWFYGERLICDLLGFGNEDALSRLNPGAALRMKYVYERWAPAHLAHHEECITRFCHFLTTNFGAPLRLDGLLWLAAMLKEREPSGRWYREGTGDALVGAGGGSVELRHVGPVARRSGAAGACRDSCCTCNYEHPNRPCSPRAH